MWGRTRKKLPQGFEEELRSCTERGDLTKLSMKYNISLSTVSRYKAAINRDPQFKIFDNRYIARRIFSDEEEAEISADIRCNYLAKKRMFTDIDFVQIAADYWAKKHKDNTDGLCRFNVSKGWIWRFKERNRFSSRRINVKRRPSISKIGNDEHIKRLKEIINKNSTLVFNCDETTWQLVPNGLQTWTDTGSQNVEVYFDGDVKKRITALCTIGADGAKLPMQIIAKGSTKRVQRSWLGDIGPIHWAANSPSAWTTQETFVEYLNNLRKYVDNRDEGDAGQKIHLLLDLYSVHKSQETRQTARALNIDLYFVPAGQTDCLQPLDISIFGPLKASAKRHFRIFMSKTTESNVSMAAMTSGLIEAWEKMQTYTVLQSWDLYSSQSDVFNEIIPPPILESGDIDQMGEDEENGIDTLYQIADHDHHDTPNEAEYSEDVYEVEAIVSMKTTHTNQKLYRVRWVGYGPEHDTWHHEDALNDCREKLEEFLYTNAPPRNSGEANPEPANIDLSTAHILLSENPISQEQCTNNKFFHPHDLFGMKIHLCLPKRRNRNSVLAFLEKINAILVNSPGEADITISNKQLESPVTATVDINQTIGLLPIVKFAQVPWLFDNVDIDKFSNIVIADTQQLHRPMFGLIKEAPRIYIPKKISRLSVGSAFLPNKYNEVRTRSMKNTLQHQHERAEIIDAPKNGYCYLCDTGFINANTHRNSDRHRKRADSNIWLEFDTLVSLYY
jgi:hypothetical protein